ncbi:MAG: glycosyltransferase family 2 protein [Planctomycetaceae bacterium]|nr:glycosyltransferase family 2 protein [Planctomycetaceae bacterium]
MSRVSIVLPTYNRALFLGEAIQSALNQTWMDLEVLVVDDGSTDATRDLVNELVEQDDRVKYLFQENAGVSAARNRALEAASGNFIAFLDSDDVWQPWKLELQLQLFQARDDVGMVWTNMDAIHPDGTPFQTNFLKTMYHAYRRLPTGSPFQSFQQFGEIVPNASERYADAMTAIGDIYSTMFFGNLVHTPTVLLRTEWARKVGLFDTSMRRGGEDFKYHLATCRLGNVGFIDVPSILYRVGNGDQITNRQNNLTFAQSYLRTIQEELANHSGQASLSPEEKQSLFAQAYDWLATEHLGHGHRVQSAVHAVRAIAVRRSVCDSWKPLVKSAMPQWMVSALKRAGGKGRSNAFSPST